MSTPAGAAELSHAQFLLDKGDWQGAAGILTKLLAGDPDNDGALRQLTACHIAAGNLTAALETAEAAASARPADPRNHVVRSDALRRLPGRGHRRAAVAAAREAVRLAPDRPAALQSLIQALLAVGRLRAVREACRIAHRLRETAPHDPATHTWCALVYQRMGNRAAERRAYRRALELDPLDSLARHKLAVDALNRWLLAKPAAHLATLVGERPTDALAAANLRAASRIFLLRLQAFTIPVWLAVLAVRLLADDRVAAAVVGAVGLAGYAATAVRDTRRLPAGVRHVVKSTLHRSPHSWLAAHLAATLAVIPLIALYPGSDGPPFAIVAAWGSLGAIANGFQRACEFMGRLTRRLLFTTVLRP